MEKEVKIIVYFFQILYGKRGYFFKYLMEKEDKIVCLFFFKYLNMKNNNNNNKIQTTTCAFRATDQNLRQPIIIILQAHQNSYPLPLPPIPLHSA